MKVSQTFHIFDDLESFEVDWSGVWWNVLHFGVSDFFSRLDWGHRS